MRRRIGIQLDTTTLSQAFVHCSDSQVLVHVADAAAAVVHSAPFGGTGRGRELVPGLEVHLKARVGSFPSVRDFYVMVFSDQYHAQLNQVRRGE